MKRNSTCVLLSLAVFPWIASVAEAEVTVAAGSEFTWDGVHGPLVPSAIVPDNLALASNGSLPIAIDAGHGPTHSVAGLNNGLYGNVNSWIGHTGWDIDIGGGEIVHTAFAGIDFAGTAAISITSFAFGRSNKGDEFADRTTGDYHIQLTTTPDPDLNTSDGDWNTIGTINIDSNDFPNTYRHEYTLNSPQNATGIRIVPPYGVAIDEIEVYGDGGEPQAPQFAPVDEGGGAGVGNLAAAGTAFANGTLAGRSVGSLNDETSGDASAWIGATPDSFAGISLGGVGVSVSSIAFGRDNTDAENDRSLGEYTVQVTDVANPDETTPDGDWLTIGTIIYSDGNPANPHLRHRINFGTQQITGIRLLTPDGAAIDELEIYEDPWVAPPPPPPPVPDWVAAGSLFTWDGVHGPLVPSQIVPDNLALASNGSLPIAIDSGHTPIHAVPKLNDGLYGNANSWIGLTARNIDVGGGTTVNTTFAGIDFAGSSTYRIGSFAFGRSNKSEEFADRTQGEYFVQLTTTPDPDVDTPDGDWNTIGSINIPSNDFPNPSRHEYTLNSPQNATGIRIVTPYGNAVDEIEVYGAAAPLVGPTLNISHDVATDDLTIRWNSQDGRLYNVRSEADLSAGAPIDWPIFGGFQDLAATPPENSVTFPMPAETERFFVVEEFPAPPEIIYSDNFENGIGEWLSGSDGREGTAWQLGSPSVVGPLAANSPTNCFGTNLDSDYGFDANVWLLSPAIDLTNAGGATLSYHQFKDIEEPSAQVVFDLGSLSILDASDNSVLAVIETNITGFTGDWEKVTKAIPAAALGKSIKMEFRLQSDGDFHFPGWYIDDVVVTVP